MIEKLNFRNTAVLHLIFVIPYFFFLSSCSVSKKISRQADKLLLSDTAIRSGHIGISIYEPATGKYWYEHDAEKYFVPASNTKLFTLYAGMKYLGDSLPGLRYLDLNDGTTVFEPTGDPTFLHSDFKNQRALSLLKSRPQVIRRFSMFNAAFMGKGWAWDDYKDDYMTQRTDFPMYGNVITIKRINKDSATIYPSFFSKGFAVMEPLTDGFTVIKPWDNNEVLLLLNGNNRSANVPFRPDPLTTDGLLADTLKKQIGSTTNKYERNRFTVLRSQPVDSLFKPMMHNSDNFFAEQTLLMVSNELLGSMNDERIIDTLLRSVFKDVPQKPQWVDGCGLSRYNMFTPQSFVYVLNKMKNEFGLERMKNILATGGTGTLASYYRSNAGSIFAKTGTLSNHTALSGYLITKSNRLLIFSIIANHFQTGATPVRRAFERFLQRIVKDY